MAAVTEATGVPHAESNRACAQSCKYLILAVKPQYFDVVFDEIREVLEEDQVVISLAPGQTISSLKERLGDEIRVVRAMPNTPAMLGAGMDGDAPLALIHLQRRKRSRSARSLKAVAAWS